MSYAVRIECFNKDGSDVENNPRMTLGFSSKEEAEKAIKYYKAHAPMENAGAYIKIDLLENFDPEKYVNDKNLVMYKANTVLN